MLPPARATREVCVGIQTLPRGLRLGSIEKWDSKWFQESDYAAWLLADLKIQQLVRLNLVRAGISRVAVSR